MLARKFINTMRKKFRPTKFEDLFISRMVGDDTWNNIPSSEALYNFTTDKHGTNVVATTNIRLAVGQIGFINVFFDYKGEGLEQEILKLCEFEIRKYGTAATMWEVCTEDLPWYSDNPHFVWKDPAHDSVSGSGWSMDLYPDSQPPK